MTNQASLRRPVPTRNASQITVENDTPIEQKELIPPTIQANKRDAKSRMGILDVSEIVDVPGTKHLLSSNQIELQDLEADANILNHLQTSKERSENILALDPEPDNSPNDPLRWSAWQKNGVLYSVGLYCLIGGGMTPILAAGFDNVSQSLDVTTQKIAITTGLYLLGLGIGSVVASPTAILYGKRPVYLGGACLLILSCIWSALASDYTNLALSRILQGIAVSPIECLPSKSITEIFFLHERAFRVGIYTLLLLGGKNLVPLASAAVIGGLGWRWVFWIVAVLTGACFAFLFLFASETFWDRSGKTSKLSDKFDVAIQTRQRESELTVSTKPFLISTSPISSNEERSSSSDIEKQIPELELHEGTLSLCAERDSHCAYMESIVNSFSPQESAGIAGNITYPSQSPGIIYTEKLREINQLKFKDRLKLANGRFSDESWLKIAVRPFRLALYPSILYSTAIYSLSIGWLIVMSEVVGHIYEGHALYNFTPLQTGLVYISPFIGGLVGSAIGGRISDFAVRFMTRHNDGIYEPEFRLVMVIPVVFSTTIGLAGFGWSVYDRDAWIVPTIFFGIISFGCSLGSTTAITYCVDSYRDYAGEALVTLNFGKNICHGLLFSLFVIDWLDAEGSRTVFLALGVIQLIFLLFSIPMYRYGKRARLWTAGRKI